MGLAYPSKLQVLSDLEIRERLRRTGYYTFKNHSASKPKVCTPSPHKGDIITPDMTDFTKLIKEGYKVVRIGRDANGKHFMVLDKPSEQHITIYKIFYPGENKQSVS